jgi:predicted GNAT family N-acyltransferase
MNTIEVKKAGNDQEQQLAFAVRREVFVTGQQCPEALEAEGNEEAVHFLATVNGQPAGAARYRKTAGGYKLERFAVLEAYRGMGVGDALVKAVLKELKEYTLPVYLHSQLPAITLYERNGFRKQGDLFVEADMEHYKMVLAQ